MMMTADAAQTSAIQVAPARRVTIPLAEAVTGLSASAMRTKIARGVWVEGREYFRDPQGGVWIDLQGVTASEQSSGRAKAASAVERQLLVRLASTKARAAAKGRQFELTAADVVGMIRRQDWSCAVSGVAFTLERIGGRKSMPFAPSIDRIESAKGYTADNVRIVCACINYMLNDFGDEAFKRVASAIRGGKC